MANLPSRHRLKSREYHRMGELGILPPDARVELIEGEVIDMAPIGSRHAGTVECLAHLLRAASGELLVRTQQPIALGDESEPVPDITVVLPRADFYRMNHPGPADVLLVVEVADSTLRHDRQRKMPLYATHGIPELWIVNLAKQELVRCVAPRDGAYQTVEILTADAAVRPIGLPNVTVKVAAIFA